MRELDIIKLVCDESFGIDIAKATRENIYVMGRCAFYKHSRDKTTYSLNQIGRMVGRDHATVLHGSQKYDRYLDQYPEFRDCFLEVEKGIVTAFNMWEKVDRKNKSKEQIELHILKNQLSRERNKNRVLKFQIRRIGKKMDENVRYVLENFTETEFHNFIETKLKPSIIMHRMQKEKMLKYNPRVNQLNIN